MKILLHQLLMTGIAQKDNYGSPKTQAYASRFRQAVTALDWCADSANTPDKRGGEGMGITAESWPEHLGTSSASDIQHSASGPWMVSC